MRYLKTIVRIVFLRVFRVHVSYTPAQMDQLSRGGVIVCANHVSLLDGVIIALASPSPLVFGVDTDYSRKSKIASYGLAMLSLMGYGTVVPIDAGSPFGLRTLRNALGRKDSVMVFPEGQISGTGQQQPDQPGVKWLVARSGASVIRVHIRGAENSKLFAKAGQMWWPRIEIEF
jgi:acyl-[acyl-carrier-protein]-phospholipid O-acyltransferase/long-chain-fatty-acid--[acyl-carrier-protein] ligase